MENAQIIFDFICSIISLVVVVASLLVVSFTSYQLYQNLVVTPNTLNAILYAILTFGMADIAFKVAS